MLKEKYGEAFNAHECWWSFGDSEVPTVSITAPRKKPVNKKDYSGYSLIEKWCNPELVCEMARQRIENTLYLGAAIPYQTVTLGPSIMGGMYGNSVVFDVGTSWQKHSLKGAEDLGAISLNMDNRWILLLDEITHVAAQMSGGEYFVSVPDLGAGAEVIASLIGAEELCVALVEEPEEIKAAIKRIIDDWVLLYNRYYEKLQKTQNGSVMWLNAFSSGSTYPVQCDFSAMISPSHFKEFFLPEIKELCGFLDDPVYHLDGKEALCHLPSLLEIKALKAIQWCPGASAKGVVTAEWIPLVEKILESGKAVHLQAGQDEALGLIEELPHKGLFLDVYCENEDSALALYKKINEKWRCSL